jgi:hypothetical protein
MVKLRAGELVGGSYGQPATGQELGLASRNF